MEKSPANAAGARRSVRKMERKMEIEANHMCDSFRVAPAFSFGAPASRAGWRDGLKAVIPREVSAAFRPPGQPAVRPALRTRLPDHAALFLRPHHRRARR